MNKLMNENTHTGAYDWPSNLMYGKKKKLFLYFTHLSLALLAKLLKKLNRKILI